VPAIPATEPLSHEKKDSVVAALLPWQAHRKCSAARPPTRSSVEAPLGLSNKYSGEWAAPVHPSRPLDLV
jgi:hypothetical protein